MRNKKRILIIIFTLLLTIIGGTFAWYTYSSKESALVLTIGDINNTRITVNPYQVRETVTPVNVYTSGVVSQVEVINNSLTSVAISFYYKINELSENLINNGLKYTITSSDSKDGAYTEVLTGDFTDYKNGMVTIYEEKLSKVKTTYYKIYLWLDSNYGDQSNLQSLSLDIELNATIYHEAAKPELDAGMIPVTIEDDGAVITIDEDNPEWYNYSQQEWANMVLVTESSRSSYVGTEDEVVNKDDILAYYVWIPRYKYKIWTTGVSSAGSEQTINIIFEDKYAPVVKGTTVGDYRTHPAFIWDGDTVSGIWVGKFETTGTGDNPTILPNCTSLTNQNVSTQFQTALKFAGGTLSGSEVSFAGSSTYGLTSGIDSHMMKNSEWGAVAYLSHSLYGINQEIYMNTSMNKITGRSVGKAASDDLSYYSYGNYTWLGQSVDENGNIGNYEVDRTLGTYASTTGNVTGVFDMSGGSFENVMGHVGEAIGSSGFTSLPDSKYDDNYIFATISSCTVETCGGHALSETNTWYNDYAGFADYGWPWFRRGGWYWDGVSAGSFNFSHIIGAAEDNNSFRSVLVKQRYKEEILNGADPDLDKGMIPVTIADDGIVTTSSIYDSNWYSYENKKWANAILVTDESRDKYFENEGVIVSEEDILAYYVWIPRYKYEIWTTGVSSTGSEQTINIVFEDADTEMSLGTTVGSYRTHPAFWWDDDSDGIVDSGETVDGIWVGKFETTGDAITPTVKPNSIALVGQNVSTQFATSQKFIANGNIYGLSHTSTNGHMMKNSEWGAVAYLSHSKYGINDEVRINNYYNDGTLTGCGAATVDEINTTTCGISYGSVADGIYPQSTTGNITGIYDMSGGAWEYVMGNFGDAIVYSGFSAMPDSKYYDKYQITTVSNCTLETCGGHALNETNGWGGSNVHFVSSSSPWFIRGGAFGDETGASIFAAASQFGGYDYFYSWRSVLVVTN